MDRKAFKQRMQSLKSYREQNPGKTYLDFKKYVEGGITDTDNTSGLQGYYDLPHNRFIIPVTEDYSNDASAHAYLPEVTITSKNTNLIGTIDKGNRNFLKAAAELLEPVVTGASLGVGLPQLGIGILKNTVPTIASLIAGETGSILGGVIGKQFDNETSNYEALGSFAGSLLGGANFLKKKDFNYGNRLYHLEDKNIWNDWGSESYVTQVGDYFLKVPKTPNKELGFSFSKAVRKKLRFNELPTSVPYEYAGYIRRKGGYSPVYKQRKVETRGTSTVEDRQFNKDVFNDIQQTFRKNGYSANLNHAGASNKWYNVQDYSPESHNIGMLDGKGKLYDAILGESVYPQFFKTLSENYMLKPSYTMNNSLFVHGLNNLVEKAGQYFDGGEIPPSNKPIIPEEPQEYKGKLYKDRYGRKYTEEQVNEYYENSTDEIDKFTGKPLVRGLKHAIDLEDAANITPIGDAISVHDTYQAVKNKDWSGAGLAALGLLPFVPNVSKMPMRSSKKLVKPKGYIPKVDPNYKQNVISRALHEKDAYSTIPANVTEEIIEQRNRAYELMQEPHAREKAKNIDTQYGTDYLKVYDSMLDKYVNVDEYFNMPDPKYKQMERPTIAAQVTPSQGTTMYFNRDIIKAPEDIPNSVVLHEMGHLVDGAAGMNNEFLKKLGDRSKFIPFNQAKTMYPNMTRDMYNNILQGTEIKSYMNQFRNYLDQNGKLNKGNYTGSYKNLKKEIIEAPKESFNNIKAIFNLYRSPKLFIKDFQMVPVVNQNNNRGDIA